MVPETLHSIFQSLPQPTFVWQYKTDDFYLVGFNEAAKQFSSNQLDRFINIKASELYKNDEEVLHDLYRCRQEKNSFEKEIYYRFKSKDLEKYIHIHYVYVNPDIVLAQPEEITEKKKLEQLLISSENRFHSLADNALVGTFIIKNHLYTYVNKEFARIFGYTVDEIIGKHQEELIVVEDRVILQKYLADNKQEAKTYSCELRGIHKSKTVLNLELFGTITTINEQEAILGTLIDISERKKSERRFIEAQEAAKVGSWETDLSNLHVIWSDETYDIFDLDKQAFSPTHNSFLEIVHPEDREKVDLAFKSSFNSKAYNTVEHRILTTKGNLKYVEERWKVSYNAANEPVRVFGTCQDITQRKIVEQELISTKLEAQDNTYRLSLAAESANLGIWDWNILEDTLLWDDRSYEIHGVKRGTDTNAFATWYNRLHPEDKDRVINELNAALRGESNYNTIFKIIKPSGETVHIKADGKVLYNEEGVPYRMIGFINDITETIQFEEKLTQNEEKQRALIENISDGIVLVDHEFNLLYQSPAVEKIVGYTIEDRRGKKAVDFIHPDDLHKCIAQYNLAKENPGKPFQSLYRTQHKNGNYIWIEVSVTNLLNLSSVQAYVVVYRDITERKLFEEKLALSSLILNSSHDAIMSISLEGIITSWNKGAQKVLGYTYDEAIGQSIYILIPPELHDEEISITQNIKDKKVIDRYETIRIKKDGTPVDVSLTVSPIMNELNEVIGASKIMRDISVQKSIEYEKAHIMNDLIQRNKDLEQFAYIVSHNLRAPVANIIGVTNFMNMPDIQPDEQVQMLGALNKSAVALDNVIKDLSLILQIRREINEQKTVIKFSEIMNEIQLAIENLIKAEKVTFSLDFSEIDEINSIKSYIYSIFYNLISNSIKYKQPQVHPIIKIRTSLVENQIILVFNDNGLGIDLKKNKDTVFGLYKRFHYHTEGKGMGLFMVKTQIETLGGKISIRSEPNRGTEFKIELPQETIR